MNPPVVELDCVTVAQAGGHVVFRDLSWTIREGETWAVVGPVGSGKTTLAETLLGKHPTPHGEVRWPLLDRLRAAGRQVNYPSEVIRHVTFKEESRLFSYAGHYYQQRFEFADADEPLTLAEFLRSGTGATDDEAREAARRLGVEAQLSLGFIKLSNGQTRRARIARALLSRPELLVLDDPFIGLDAAGRAALTELLGGLVNSGLRLVLICRPDAVPGWVTDMFECGARSVERGVEEPQGSAQGSDVFTPRSTLRAPHSPVIELRNVSVAHGGRTILRDINWTVRAGERWAVLGPNGSGKTTLLSLLCGDHPQAYSNDVRLFGRRRGTGESIWDVKRNVGLVSPEFHLYFTQPLTAERAVATGLFDVLTDRPTAPEQDAAVRDLMGQFGIAHLAGRPFRQLSTGEQRLVLFARAVVKRPPLLILDEPFQGLDDGTVSRLRAWLDAGLASDQTLLFVSHHLPEIPRSVTRRLRLEDGAVVELV
ncbi:MAG TPA: ATP-binding cassette domain-containing protein [Gemmataceae bacterium]|nr:ATP-binding cassette domain-containing protein [Gemmataceae bacterium]